MVALELRLFGDASITLPHSGVVPLTGRTGDLLACLAVNRGRPVARESLAEWLWRDVSWDQGRRRLNSTLYRLRSLIEPDLAKPKYIVSPSRANVLFSEHPDCWLDIEAFESTVSELAGIEALDPAAFERLEAAVGLYTGDLCASATGGRAVAQRVRLANLALAARTKLAEDYLQIREPTNALRHANAALAIDNLREDIHRIVIRCRMENGDRAGAVRHFEELKDLLSTELDANPMPETTRLVIDLTRRQELDAAAVEANDILTILEDTRSGLLSLLRTVDTAASRVRRLKP